MYSIELYSILASVSPLLFIINSFVMFMKRPLAIIDSHINTETLCEQVNIEHYSLNQDRESILFSIYHIV